MKKLILFWTLIFTSTTFAKRAEPPEIKPVIKYGTEFKLKIETNDCSKSDQEPCGMYAFVISKNLSSRKTNWKTELYQKLFDPKLETDVQSVFPKSLKVSKKKIYVTDEKRTKYILDTDGNLIKPLKSVIYPASKKNR